MPEIGEAIHYGLGGLVVGIHGDGRLDIVHAVKAIDDSGEKVITQIARGVDLESDNIPRELPVIDRRRPAPPAPVEGEVEGGEEEGEEEISGILENSPEEEAEGEEVGVPMPDEETGSQDGSEAPISLPDTGEASGEPPVVMRPTVVDEEEAEEDAPADEGETAQMTFSTEMKAADARAKIAALTDPTTLQIFVQDETRATVLKAAEKRIGELGA